MKRPNDTYVFNAELGQRLRDLRLKAGLTQLELARAMCRGGKNAGNLVGRLERGGERYPSLGLIADFLRGCRAGFKDILDTLDLYTELPTARDKVYDRVLKRVADAVPQKWQAQVTNYDLSFEIPKPAAKPAPEQLRPDRMKRLERARKMAAAAQRRFAYGQLLKNVVGKTGEGLHEIDRTALFNHGLEWFSILRDTRKSRAATRESRLAAAETRFAKASQLPLDVIRQFQDKVQSRFREMEISGDLDPLPDMSLDEYEAGLLAPVRKRSLGQQEHDEHVRKVEIYNAARRKAIERIWNEAQPTLDESGVPIELRPVYHGLVGACCTAALNFEPGSAGERAQLDEYILEPRWIALGLDTALAQKLAGNMLARFRELARSFPPDPRSKR